jgi:hypothetical protein
MSDSSLKGWMPIGVNWRDGAPEVDWCLTRGERWTEPFYEDSLRRLVSRPFNAVFRRRSDAATLEQWVARRRGLTPSGFIFHMSRCGSTLVSQMLAGRRDSIVLSEASAIDAMLRPPVAVSAERHAAWLRALIGAMGEPRFGETHYFIKFDCWHILYLPLIIRAFPSVPRVFLYREPVAVLASHLRQRGVQTVPQLLDPRVFGIDPSAAATMPPRTYCARILGRMLTAAGSNADTLPLHYRTLPDAVLDMILPLFGVPSTAEDRIAMDGASRQHSKRPMDRFSQASDAPPLPPDDPAWPDLAAYTDAPYQVLEQRRARLA